jgi:DNA-binding transcriptional LysR family regulator
MDRLETMKIFVAVAEEAGFAAAARRLSLSPPAVTRAIAALEERIGTRLLQRTTRTVRLTEAGARFLADSRRLLVEVEEAERSAGGLHEKLRGQLGVTASVNFGRRFVAPIVIDFLRANPEVNVRALFVDRVVDFVDEGLDVAVRIASLPDSALTAVRVGATRRVVCASPAYLKARGTPEKPGDVAEHDTVGFIQGVTEPVWPEWSFTAGGKRVMATPRTRLAVNSVDVAVAAAVKGRGLTRLLAYQVDDEVRAGRLRIVLQDYEPAPLPVHVIYAGGKRTSAKVRAFVDLAVEGLRAAEFS